MYFLYSIKLFYIYGKQIRLADLQVVKNNVQENPFGVRMDAAQARYLTVIEPFEKENSAQSVFAPSADRLIVIVCDKKRIRSSSRAPYSQDEKDCKTGYIYWLDEGFVLFRDKQVAEGRPKSPFFRHHVLAIFHYVLVIFHHVLIIFHHFLM